MAATLFLLGNNEVFAAVHSNAHNSSGDSVKPEKEKTKYITLPKDLFVVPDVQKPQLLNMPKPEYPHEYKIRGIPGDAVVELLVTAEGKPKYVGVISSTAKPFGEALKAAVEQAEFIPGTANGVPTAVKIKFPYDFEIKDDEE
jgi:TonB family protein